MPIKMSGGVFWRRESWSEGKLGAPRTRTWAMEERLEEGT